MKKLLFILITFIFCYSSEPILSDVVIQSKYWNRLMNVSGDMPIRIYFYPEEEIKIAILVQDIMCIYGIGFPHETLVEIQSILNKYLSWEKTATEKGIKVGKVIGSITTPAVFFVYGGNQLGNPAKITFAIFSQSTKVHQLVISYPEIVSVKNPFIKFTPETLYLSKQEAIKLKNQLTIENVWKETQRFLENNNLLSE